MISVLVTTQSHYPVDRKRIVKVVSDALSKVIKRDCEVSVTVIGDRQMHRLNKTYRNVDETTDVLSFGMNETLPNAPQFLDMPDKVLRLGDIVVSYPQAVADAAAQNKLVDEMIDFLIIHGLNHLLGIHHPE
jgi:probable rRNA maturation factor